MQYLGGKSRIKKPLAEFLLKHRKPNQTYVETFLGAASVFLEIKNPRIGTDCHKDLMLMWKAVQDGWMPPNVCSEDEYQKLRYDEPSALRGYIGFQCSFGGKWFGGYARNSSGLNYCLCGHASLRYAFPRLQGAYLGLLDYRDYTGISGALIYCDPPYEGTTKFSMPFDHIEFWEWVRQMSLSNDVFVSSYVAPEGFLPVLEIPTKTAFHVKGGGKSLRVEKVFQFDEKGK